MNDLSKTQREALEALPVGEAVHVATSEYSLDPIPSTGGRLVLRGCPSSMRRRLRPQKTPITEHERYHSISEAIARSRSHNESVQLTYQGEITELITELFTAHDIEADYARENDGTWDVWSTDDSNPVRLHVTVKPGFRVYEAREGDALVFCGDFATLEEAQAHAEPDGLDQFLWGTAAAAGHVNGMAAPEGDDGPAISWHGADGYYCVCQILGA